MHAPKLSIVVSVYNEEAVLPYFIKEFERCITFVSEYELIFVNDGSTDKSKELICTYIQQNHRVKLINFSRNFGHESAMFAGIELAKGEAIVCLDADLQHPPAVLQEMYQKFTTGVDVLVMNRKQNSNNNWLKQKLVDVFYGLINTISKDKIEPNASDFFLLSQRAAQAVLNNYTERNTFLRAIIQNLGFNQDKLNFEAPKRVQGESKYNFKKLLLFSFQAIANYSNAPLRIGLILGLIYGSFSLLILFYSVLTWFLDRPYSGYTTIVLLVSSGFALIFFVLGIIGEYLGYIFSESKKRPRFIVEKVYEAE